jgi:branched-chain amino acid aminotransferase
MALTMLSLLMKREMSARELWPNIFCIKNGELHTPSVEFDLLEGITRRTIIELARDKGMKVIERAISKDELVTFDEIFFCGSSARVTPILSIDKKKVGNGKMGKLTGELARLYDDATKGKIRGKENWIKVAK